MGIDVAAHVARNFGTLYSARGLGGTDSLPRLNDAGYHATLVTDVTGLASKVKNCRGFLPDQRANVYEAMLAGLAKPGVHGYAITPQFGVRQRFMAIVTDMPLPNDPLPAFTSACDGCAQPCTGACPTHAITTHVMPLTIEGKTINLYDINCFACDWAKRYALSNVEGPAQMLERLVLLKLVTRSEDPADRRSKQIVLTEKGRQILQEGNLANRTWLEELAQSMTAEEQEQVRQAIVTLKEKAHQFDSKPK